MAVATSKPPTDGDYTSPVRRHSADKRRLGSRQVLFRPPILSLKETSEKEGEFIPLSHQYTKSSGQKCPSALSSSHRIRHHP